jgi:hypothetical protein
VPTALSSTEATPTTSASPGLFAAGRRATQDVAILFRFRAQAVRRRHLTRTLVLSFVVVTQTVATVPTSPARRGAARPSTSTC